MITVYYVNAVETGALLTFLKSFLRSRSAQWTFTTLAGEGELCAAVGAVWSCVSAGWGKDSTVGIDTAAK